MARSNTQCVQKLLKNIGLILKQINFAKKYVWTEVLKRPVLVPDLLANQGSLLTKGKKGRRANRCLNILPNFKCIMLIQMRVKSETVKECS